eukprot:Skav232198  [mRNA]  locus=scaffold3716:99180:102349:- [translate_table: standard]
MFSHSQPCSLAPAAGHDSEDDSDLADELLAGFEEGDWWDVKGAVKTLGAAAAHPHPFKPTMQSPLRSLALGDCTKYILIDPAHTWAIDGVGKDFLASTIIMLARAGHWGHGAIPHRLANAYSRFLAFCNAYKKTTSIADFDYSTFKLPQNSLDLQHQLSRLQCRWVLNPSVNMTWSDEDFIGRVARVSRKTHSATTARRTISRCLGLYRRQWIRRFGSVYRHPPGLAE